MPWSPDRTAASERPQVLHDGLAALATMDDATREAYLSERQPWENAPLDEPSTAAAIPLSARALLARWRSVPVVDPKRFRADLDGLDSAL